MAFHGGDTDPEKNLILRLSGRFFHPATEEAEGKFFVRKGWRLAPATLFPGLVVVELSDIIFAVDSIPAILAISTDPFIVYTSNVFAILGLRALYFALAGIMKMFHYLHYGLSFILTFVGVKMLIADYYKIPVSAALGVIAIIILGCILPSMIHERRLKAAQKDSNGLAEEQKKED